MGAIVEDPQAGSQMLSALAAASNRRHAERCDPWDACRYQAGPTCPGATVPLEDTPIPSEKGRDTRCHVSSQFLWASP